jgi:hypothetical protein
MSPGALDPLLHHPERLRIVATLAALPDGDAISLTRLQAMIGLTSATLIIRLGELDHARYVSTGKSGAGRVPANAALAGDGRAALERYTAALRHLATVASDVHQVPAPHMRAGDADRDAAAAALGEHFAQGRLTLDELNARLGATLTATTHGDLSNVGRDLPDLTALPAHVRFPGGKRTIPGHKSRTGSDKGAWQAWRSEPPR